MKTDDGDLVGRELADLFRGLGGMDHATHVGLKAWLDGAVSDLGQLLRRQNMGATFVAAEQAKMRRSFWARMAGDARQPQ